MSYEHNQSTPSYRTTRQQLQHDIFESMHAPGYLGTSDIDNTVKITECILNQQLIERMHIKVTDSINDIS
jgi:hypothetical protein